MNKNIILCGVGGQGTVLASKQLRYSRTPECMQPTAVPA